MYHLSYASLISVYTPFDVLLKYIRSHGAHQTSIFVYYMPSQTPTDYGANGEYASYGRCYGVRFLRPMIVLTEFLCLHGIAVILE